MKTISLLAFLFAFVLSTKANHDGQFLIRHVGDLCAYAAGHNYIRLSSSCHDLFSFTPSRKLLHKKTGKCVAPLHQWNNAKLALVSCSLTTAHFMRTHGNSIEYVNNGKCVHPYGGKARPKLYTPLVIYYGCNQHRLSFVFEYTFVIQHFGGLCVHVRNSHLILSRACNERFQLTSSNALRNIRTGKCVVPVSTKNNARLVLTSDCSTRSARFAATAHHSAKHLATGKCMHPLGGKLHPKAGTPVVIYSGCDERRLQFRFLS